MVGHMVLGGTPKLVMFKSYQFSETEPFRYLMRGDWIRLAARVLTIMAVPWTGLGEQTYLSVYRNSLNHPFLNREL